MDKKVIIDEMGIKRSLTRIAYEIIEHNKGIDNIVLVGIKTRGEFLAKRLSKIIESVENTTVPSFALDVSPYRDDIVHEQIAPLINLVIKDKKVILVDDVLFQGRTVRAAMDAIMAHGRAKEIQLAILIDRGHRQLPIHPDYIGKNIPSALNEKIAVHLAEIDGQDGVYIER